MKLTSALFLIASVIVCATSENSKDGTHETAVKNDEILTKEPDGRVQGKIIPGHVTLLSKVPAREQLGVSNDKIASDQEDEDNRQKRSALFGGGRRGGRRGGKGKHTHKSGGSGK